jgi:hypothetical protein
MLKVSLYNPQKQTVDMYLALLFATRIQHTIDKAKFGNIYFSTILQAQKYYFLNTNLFLVTLDISTLHSSRTSPGMRYLRLLGAVP